MALRDTLKSYFVRYAKPTAAQFAALIDAVRLNSETIAITDINGLSNVLGGKASADVVNTLGSQVNTMRTALVVHPAYNAPLAALTSGQAGTNYEVGQSINVTVNAGFTQNDGGSASAYDIQRNGATVSENNAFTENLLMALAAVTYQAYINYATGATKNNNFGEADTTGKIYAGVVPSNTLTFQGYYAIWYAPVAAAPATSAAVRAMAGKQLTVQGNTFTLNTGNSQLIMAVVVPPGKTLASVVDLDALNAVITSEYILQGTISVNDAAGNPVPNYKLYTKTLGVAYSTSHRHQINLS